MNMSRKGWPKEPARHSLSARGVRTGTKKPCGGTKRTAPYKSAKEVEVTTWKSKDFGARLIISSKLMEEGVKPPLWDEDPETSRYVHNKFKITVENWDNKKKASFNWYDSYQNYMDGVTKMDEHDILNAVASWLEDASAVEQTEFEGWADDMGYGSDSRHAERIYKELEKGAKKIDELLGPEYGPDVWSMMSMEIREKIGEV